jgi:trehalose-6-phosphate synthase
MRRRFSFVQIAVPSRMDIEAYDRLANEVERSVAAINRRFGDSEWSPITLIEDSIPADTLASYYRVADLCLITSLQDGMNLVAKEYVACQLDRQGVLILSEFAGAAHEMKGAVLVNPRDAAMVSQSVVTALTLPAEQRARAMARMQDRLPTVYQWMSELISAWGSTLPFESRRAGR